MARSIQDTHEHEADPALSGEEWVAHVFSFVMFGLCAIILFMIVMGHW